MGDPFERAHCPKCACTLFEYVDVDPEADWPIYRFRCFDCGADWREVELAGLRIVEPPF